MALFDAFTGDAYSRAADQQRAYLNQVQAGIGNAKTQGLAALQSGQAGAIGAIQPAIQQGRVDLVGMLGPAVGALQGGQTSGVGALTAGQEGGLAALQGGVNQAVGAYNPVGNAAVGYGAAGGQANQAQADALGLNGPEGAARARATFQSSPGYQFQLEQGVDALTRSANAAGMGASGNTLLAAQKYGQGLADQDYQAYLAQLAQRQQLYAPLESGALQQQAQGQANAYLTGGTGGANIYTGTAGKLSDLYSNTGTNLASAYLGTGRSLADLDKTGGLATADILGSGGAQQANLISNLSGQSANLAPAYAGTYGAEAAAQTAASGNLFNLGLQGLRFAGAGGYLPSGGNSAYRF